MRPARGIGPSLLAAAILAVALVLGTGGAAPVQAADDGLAIVTKSTYTLAPKDRAVHVSVSVKATNTKPNLVEQTPNGKLTTKYFFERATLVIQHEASRIRASAGPTRLAVTPHESTETVKVVDVAFRADLFYRQTTSFRLDYDLPGGAPRTDGDIRVGAAFATFYVWTFGDRGDVRVVVPAGFTVTTTGSPMATATVDGATVLSATAVTNVTEWYAIIVADRHDALTRERLDLAGGEHLVVRAWPEDQEWQTRVGGLLRRGLPTLDELVGLPWPVAGDIEVTEVHTPLLEGYGGVYRVGEDRIEISEELDDLTIIHEASHAWFNSGLFVGRWIDEGLADEYAALVLDKIAASGQKPDPVEPDGAGNVRLNDWVHPGRITDEKTNLREQFGYDASWTVIRALIDEIGVAKMRSVLAAAANDWIPYVGAVAPERLDGPADWRRLLDLLDETGGSSGADELFSRWVVLDAERPLLAARTEARTAYAELVRAGAGWLPAIAVRGPMADWNFDAAAAQIRAAAAILATRDRIAALASSIGASPAATLRSAYEAATDLAPVGVEADRELTTLQALAATRARLARPLDLVTTVGLIGANPTTELAAAIAAFGTGDTVGASAAASRADALLAGAPDTGRTRLVAGGGVISGAALVAGGGAVLLWRRRRRPPAQVSVEAVDANGPAETIALDGPAEAVGVADSAEPVGNSGAAETWTSASDTTAGSDAPDSYVTLGAPPAETAGQDAAAPGREEEH